MVQLPPHCSWKEILAYVIAYHDTKKMREVAKLLGDQLLKSKTDINSAIVCYILSGELEIVIDLWKKRALYQIRKLNFEKNEALLNLYQKSIIMKTASKNPNKTVEDIDLIVTDLAEFFMS